MKNIEILTKAGYQINYYTDEYIEILHLKFNIVKQQITHKAIWSYKITEIKNNKPAITKFLNRYGAINDLKHREVLKNIKITIDKELNN